MGDLVQGSFPRQGAPIWGRQRRLWWLLWSRCPGLGWQRLRSLEACCGGLAGAWDASADELAEVPGLGRGLVAAVERFRHGWGPRPLEAFAPRCRFGRGVLVPGDRSWPAGLRELQRPPLQLCWRGRGSLWPHLGHGRSVAVVGTRRPSLHGLSMARAIGAALAEAGWPVLSGLAEGIDGAVHGGCLAAGGAPVGVLGTPLGRAYPLHHAALQNQVAREGLLVSELAEGGRVRPGSFVARNRLLVAMAAAVVVVECPVASGALHSAELAWQQGLPLWVVPADAGRASALGSNRLLARGATPLLLPADLIGQLGRGPLARRSPAADPAPARGCQGAEAEGLLAAVGGGASLEQLSLALDRPMAELMPRLLELELDGLLRAEAGLCWRPC
ncbi:DNA-processing protein DprA [Cyanobium sp. Cruz-8D1]|uniref:DNA-processing protein DprA n=1 Tax=Cyanobium sp. Cruz-8D1 TaxID=2823711 RepID=UPI0020CD1C02|nr:DNA-processing protein DprA [Cyanobium sp. Cruz-8D1]MCP9859594.1 DNA-processing protein DprA [Cyanobium sp. Cruz-8H5]MCP9867978.1 DNA-processing protein DprA [Cyanobium sp. Cruz-8D1]